MGYVRFILIGSGLSRYSVGLLYLCVYAQNTVDHMIYGHVYARALRGHFLVCAALNP